MKYHQLSQTERYQIQAGIALGFKIKDIALKLNRHRSTIFRELKRNGHISQEGYSAHPAQMDYWQRRLKCRPKLLICGNLKKYIDTRIKSQWSPEQIAGRRKLETKSPIGTETIYQYLFREKQNGGSLWKNLRHSKGRRLKRFPQQRWPKSLNRLPAESRPKDTINRSTTGHFERDLIVGRDRQGYLMTIVDRKTRFTIIKKIEHPRAELVHQSTIKAFRYIKVKSLTNDNGVEFTAYKKTSARLRIPIYFTRPYASWERGTVENTNKLIRQYFPKHTNLKEISHEQIKMVQTLLNHRPRKLLGFKSPIEIPTSIPA
jgi:IS30 family transposase